MYIAIGYASDDIDLVYTAAGYARPISQLAYTAVGVNNHSVILIVISDLKQASITSV